MWHRMLHKKRNVSGKAASARDPFESFEPLDMGELISTEPVLNAGIIYSKAIRRGLVTLRMLCDLSAL